MDPLAYAPWRSSRLGTVTEALEREAVLDLAGPLAGRDLLDVGCGDGAYALAAARAGARVAGLDASPEAIEAARRTAAAAGVAADLRTGDALHLPWPDASFDLVVAVTALCFVRDAGTALREMARVLRPGGRLVLGDLASPSLWAAWRRLRAWAGSPTWRAARFRSAVALRGLVAGSGLVPGRARACAFYPPVGAAARLLAPLDRRLGRRFTFGAAFVALEASKPRPDPRGPVD